MGGTIVLPYRYTVRRGTAAALAAVNEVPLAGEFVVETDTGLTTGVRKFKIGDGVTAWSALPYFTILALQSIVAGAGITVDDTDPLNPVVASTSAGIESVVAGSGIAVDDTDPLNPVVSVSGTAAPNYLFVATGALVYGPSGGIVYAS